MVLFGLMIALLCGALYHFLRGGGPGRLVLYLVLSSIGFVLGDVFGAWQGWEIFPMGSLNIGMSVAGSIIVMVVGDWLSRLDIDEEESV